MAKKLLIKKPLKTAAISGILALILGIIGQLIRGVSQNVVVISIYNIIPAVFGILFLYGFYVLAKKYKVKLLEVMIIIFIVLGIISLVLGPIYSNYVQNLTESLMIAGQNVQDVLTVLGPFMVIILLSLLVGLTSYILYGVGFIQLGKHIPLAQVTGILMIVGIATLIIFIGLFILIAVYVMQLIILFQESAKARE